MKRVLVSIFILSLPALACGVRTSPALKAESAIISESTPAMRQPVLMVVVADEGLNIRAMPSESAQDVGDLFPGDIIHVDDVRMIGDSNWCHHEYGWSNCKWLKALEAIR